MTLEDLNQFGYAVYKAADVYNRSKLAYDTARAAFKWAIKQSPDEIVDAYYRINKEAK